MHVFLWNLVCSENATIFSFGVWSWTTETLFQDFLFKLQPLYVVCPTLIQKTHNRKAKNN